MENSRMNPAIPSTQADWLAVDWGTSHLRVWAMSDTGTILAARDSNQGMSGLQREEFEPALLALVNDWLSSGKSIPVIVCGMAGSRQGWQEASYLNLPIRLPAGFQAVPVTTRDPRLNVHILPGLKQENPADVMRGEETQIAGFLANPSDFDGLLVMPGTHTKWARIRQQTLSQFVTCMTGELFDLLVSHSLLRHSVSQSGWSEADFDDAFLYALDNPAGFTQRLFGLRAASLLHGQSAEAARARLSAELLALEVVAIRSSFPDIAQLKLAVIGTDTLARLYCHALELAGYTASAYSGDSITLTGLRAAYQAIRPILEEATHA